MEKLVEIMEDQILIEFKPMIKCRTEIHVRSLHHTDIITFKVQSTAPSRFHVTPPAGLLHPLSTVALRITLRPQPELPTTTDHFLIRASLDSKTQDTKLRVSYTGPSTDRDFSYFNPLFNTSAYNNKPEEFIEKETAEEMVLLVAARRGDITKLQSLLKKKPAGAGVSTDSKDQYNTTALHCAALKGHREAVSMLVAFGIEIESQDVEGHTALHLAVEGGSLDTTEMLINLGADVEAKTNRGATPLRIARSMGYAHIEHLLTSRGASI
ncbi:Integral membrane ankyrin-repeat protein Kidins220 (protein kinase D substrate) protein [Dioscorea alata]|uniref:Integral membrane ankyrin-repeat protein Kidins220 (Protein kinase D substrate) protein n=1 Tax=Dioscorea alata TaxID=55571 RepID=A0ACB7U8V0_DIOAL|nr:Integral membrane ankyrin-repeat protein Kidins220 (protein kinase D substrate) protein [Dioscorea alata]